MTERRTARLRTILTDWQLGVFALVCYIPALLAHPGRLPSDTKLYLYLDPGGLMRSAPRAWDATQYGGWVPHQTISYLWPSGPWYWAFDKLGVPDWIAQRLWIATLLLCAGLGARWLARLLGLGRSAALVTALFYMLSPYVLPYISRTSLMLLPFSGLCWLIGLTIKSATGSSWRAPSLFALVMFTVAAPNFTAIVMVAPGPVLWLVDAIWRRTISLKTALLTACKLAALSFVVSLWWVVMLSIQSKHGANVLGFSETLQAVSLTSLSTETLRGLGYWLFYIRDLAGPATSAAAVYLTSTLLMVVSLAVLIGGFAGLSIVRWSARRFAVLLVLAGTILAVSVHPIDSASPLMSPLANASRSGLALSMRSSTRALPLSVLGFALAWGALVTVLSNVRLRWPMRWSRRRPMRWRTVVVPLAAGLLAVVNLPALFTGDIADPAISHDENPPAGWTAAAAALSKTPQTARVLQLPGAPFGAYRWGYTVDPVLPGLTAKPYLNRDLLPLGSPGAMDLLYALDDRFQAGTIEPTSIAPIARYLGADTIFSPNDVAFDRFRTPRPEITNQVLTTTGVGLGTTAAYGVTAPNAPSLATIDEDELSNPLVGTALATTTVTDVTDPQPIIRAKARTVLVVGSADGLVDASASGLLDGSELIRYAADTVHPDARQTATAATTGTPETPSAVIITDSNRDRAEQWRSSRDTLGFTEDGTATGGVSVLDSADARLAVFPEQTSQDETIAIQGGGLTATASAYGEPFAYRPEDRAYMAVDNDPTTAWLVADRANADGAFITVTSPEAVTSLTLTQPSGAGQNRWITAATVSYDHGPPQPLTLDDTSRKAPGQTVTAPAAFTSARITITATTDNDLNPFGHSAVGFATITAAAADGSVLSPTTEVVRPPTTLKTTPTANALFASLATSYVFTRDRTSPTDRWRSDPEPTLTRDLSVSNTSTMHATVTVRLDQRAADRTIAALLAATGAATADSRLTGVAADGGYAAVDGDPNTAWVGSFGRYPGQQTTGTLTIPLKAATTISQIRIRQSTDPRFATITSVALSSGGTSAAQKVPVPAPDAGGMSVVDFSPISGTQLVLTVDSTDAKTTIDRRSGEPTALPFSIQEIDGDGIGPTRLPAALDTGCRTDLVTLDGMGVGVQIVATTSELLSGKAVQAKLCGNASGATTSSLTVAAGEHVLSTAPGMTTGLDIDRITLIPAAQGTTSAESSPSVGATTVPTTGAGAVRPNVTSTKSTHDGDIVSISGCADGCWLVNGEGYERGWTATSNGRSLGEPAQVDGGFNGWWLPAGSDTRSVTLSFGPQHTLDIALLLSALGVLGCIAVAVFAGKRASNWSGTEPRIIGFRGAAAGPPVRPIPTAVVWLLTAAVAALVISPAWGAIGLVVSGVVLAVRRRPQLLAVTALAGICVIAARMLWILRHVRPAPDPTWTFFFESLHRPALLAVVLLFGSVLLDSDTPPAEATSER